MAHGWVHTAYAASGNGWFGPGEVWGWNGRSWLLSGTLEEGRILAVATPLFLLDALGFAVGAVGYVPATGW